MKKIFFFLLPLAFIFSQACNKDQRMVNKIEGEWEIEQITFTRNGQDSVAMAPIGIFSFESCKLGNGNCPGYYDLENQDQVTIGYNIDADLNELNINIPSSRPDVEFLGKYTIDSFTKERLSISGIGSIRDGETKRYDVKIDLKKR